MGLEALNLGNYIFTIFVRVFSPKRYNARCATCELINTGHFIMFSMITNIYNKKTKGPTLMELFTATGKLKKIFFYN